jgi:hypothetical protein
MCCTDRLNCQAVEVHRKLPRVILDAIGRCAE